MYCNRKRHSIKYVKEKTKEIAEGYKCLEENYINNRTKLKFKCKEGHIFFMKWARFQRGCRCAECARNKKLTLSYVKRETKKIAKGYKCISDKYKNAGNKLTFLCDKNHIFKMNWNNFKQGKIISDYASKLSENKEAYEKQFSSYLKNKIKPEDLPKHIEEVKSKIMKGDQSGR